MGTQAPVIHIYTRIPDIFCIWTEVGLKSLHIYKFWRISEKKQPRADMPTVTREWSFSNEQLEQLQQFWKMSSMREKLKFIFELCDLNSNMLVEKGELRSVLKGVFEYCGVDDEDDLCRVDSIVERIFEEKDTNRDDLLTEMEFLAENEIDAELFQTFENLVDITPTVD